MRCWQYGVEPTGTVNIQNFSDPEPVYLPTGWPPGDHRHAVDPPSAEDLQRQGHQALRRILEDV